MLKLPQDFVSDVSAGFKLMFHLISMFTNILHLFRDSLQISQLTYYSPMLLFYTPWKHQKTYSELFWSAFSCIWTECGEMRANLSQLINFNFIPPKISWWFQED